MPFGNTKINPEEAHKLEQIYVSWIKPTVEAIKYGDNAQEKIVCHRADKSARSEEIITHIIENLATSDIVIADLSGRNPNVFYELGVRHAISNRTILISENIDDVPFDLRGIRAIKYTYDPENMLKFKTLLGEAINQVLSDPNRIDNPVRRYIMTSETEKIMKQTKPPSYEIVNNILSEISFLKNEFNNQTKEIRNVLNLITSNDINEIGISNEAELKMFEGAWINRETESVGYAKVVDNQLYIPYCYGGNTELTGHYFNCRLIGRTLFARFEWFDEPISGLAFFNIESNNKLVGGWWYGEDVPNEIMDDVSRIHDRIPGMVKSTFNKIVKDKKFPSWASNYFDYKLYHKKNRRRREINAKIRNFEGLIS